MTVLGGGGVFKYTGERSFSAPGDYYEYTEGIPYKKGLQVLKRPW